MNQTKPGRLFAPVFFPLKPYLNLSSNTFW